MAVDDINAFLASQKEKQQLRFILYGSVDDGKSTLLDRLLYDSKTVFEDQFFATASESQIYGTQGDAVDLALLVDGLQAEREQGITIDVAYRYFETNKRKFIAADVPGHEQYTRNMVTGASNADLAVILVDANKNILTQTRRHSYIVSLMGIRQVILAVNKMDLIDYDKDVFLAIDYEYGMFARKLGIEEVNAVPLSALTGENVFTTHGDTPWYKGPTLMELLENVAVHQDGWSSTFRLPVQWVNRPHSDFRGFSGTIASGYVECGMSVVAGLSGQQSTVERILGPSGNLEKALPDQAITLVLADEIDISRGDIIASPDLGPEVSDQFSAHLIWMDSNPLLPERPYLIKFASASAIAQVTDLTHRIKCRDLGTLSCKETRTERDRVLQNSS